MWKIDGAPNSAVRQIFDGKDLCPRVVQIFPRSLRANQRSSMPPAKKAAPAAPKPVKVKGIAQWCQEDTAVRS